VRAASRTINDFLLQRRPGAVTMEWAVSRRRGKVFLDTNRNARGKTLASVYSPRATPEAAVSMPVAWDELMSIYPTDFTVHTVPARLEQRGDLWAGLLAAKQDLRTLLEAEP
jgi:DNA primase